MLADHLSRLADIVNSSPFSAWLNDADRQLRSEDRMLVVMLGSDIVPVFADEVVGHAAGHVEYNALLAADATLRDAAEHAIAAGRVSRVENLPPTLARLLVTLAMNETPASLRGQARALRVNRISDADLIDAVRRGIARTNALVFDLLDVLEAHGLRMVLERDLPGGDIDAEMRRTGQRCSEDLAGVVGMPNIEHVEMPLHAALDGWVRDCPQEVDRFLGP